MYGNQIYGYSDPNYNQKVYGNFYNVSTTTIYSKNPGVNVSMKSDDKPCNFPSNIPLTNYSDTQKIVHNSQMIEEHIDVSKNVNIVASESAKIASTISISSSLSERSD